MYGIYTKGIKRLLIIDKFTVYFCLDIIFILLYLLDMVDYCRLIV